MKQIINYIREIYAYRELIINLAIKDFKVRYKSAVLGFLWMLLNPVLQMIVLSVVFTLYIRVETDSPYPLFLLCGLLPWNFLSVSLGAGAHSLVDEANLVKKINFPREIIPISIVTGHLINFLTALLLFLPFPLIFCHTLSLRLLWLFVPMTLLLFFVLALTALVSNLNVFYRDTRYIVEALVMAWFYATPIFYKVEMVADAFNTLAARWPTGARAAELVYKLNPMIAIVEMFRSILLKGGSPALNHILYVVGFTVVIGGLAIFLFRRRGPVMADYL